MRGWLSRPGPRFVGVLVVALVLAAVLRPLPPRFVFRHGGDCVRYLDWSRLVAERGLAAFPALLGEWHARWVGFPPPTRWTWLLLIAGVMRLWPFAPGPEPGFVHDDYAPIVLISWLAGVLSLLPLGLWLRRLAPLWVTALALLLAATSPLLRGMSRFPLPDSLQLFNTLAVLWATSEWMVSRRRWLLVVQALFAFLLCTVRETGLLSVLTAAALAGWQQGRPLPGGADEPGEQAGVEPRRDGRARAVWLALLAGCVLALVLTLPVVGGPGPFVNAVVTYVGSVLRTGNLAYVSGPPYRYLVDFMIVAPAVTATALMAAPLLLVQRRAGLRELVPAVVLVTLLLLATNSALTKTLRYVMAVEVGMRVLAAAAVYALWQDGRPWPRRAALALGITLVAVDQALFQALFARDQVYDPVTWSIARQLGLIPR
ncbi:MAG: hypothetical protein U1A78_12505 [Polyangia bacterium]